MTKHDAMKAYFEPKIVELTGISSGFNFSSDTEGSASLVTTYSDKVVKKYVRAAEKEYGFSIIVVKPFSPYGDDLNLAAMNFAQALMDWIEEQNRKENFPEFPENCQIKKIETLQNMPNLSGINGEQSLARYMIQGRVLYFEKEV